jgi:hypothetical protein
MRVLRRRFEWRILVKIGGRAVGSEKRAVQSERERSKISIFIPEYFARFRFQEFGIVCRT